MEPLAVDGGRPVIPQGLAPTGVRFDEHEEEAVLKVLRSGKLNRYGGTAVTEFEERFREYLGTGHALMSTSGTAAIHIALGALNLEPGSEVITSPITDMGSIMPILLSLCIPVFADIDEETWEIDPEDIERKITARTKAILAIHLAGNAVDIAAVRQIADRHGLVLIEDCAQAYGTSVNGRPVGTFGDLGCFSLNQYKHITCGDGGITVTDDDGVAERAQLFADKAWPRDKGRTSLFVAPNYRVTELQAAVALAQLDKLEGIVDARNSLGDRLTEAIGGLSGIRPQSTYPGSRHTYWFYAFRTDPQRRERLVKALQGEGISAAAGYIPKPVYLYDVFHGGTTFGTTTFPYGYEPFRPVPDPVTYDPGICPVAEEICRDVVRIPFDEFWQKDDVDQAAEAIRKVHYWVLERGA